MCTNNFCDDPQKQQQQQEEERQRQQLEDKRTAAGRRDYPPPPGGRDDENSGHGVVVSGREEEEDDRYHRTVDNNKDDDENLYYDDDHDEGRRAGSMRRGNDGIITTRSGEERKEEKKYNKYNCYYGSTSTTTTTTTMMMSSSSSYCGGGGGGSSSSTTASSSSSSSSSSVDEEEEEHELEKEDTPLLVYQHHPHTPNNDDDHHPPSYTTDTTTTTPTTKMTATMYNFIIMSILFSFNHGCTVSCLSLATSRLGSTLGASQSITLYVTYTLTAILGLSAYLTKRLGGKFAMVLAMGLFCLYVGCFYLAIHVHDVDDVDDDDSGSDDRDGGSGSWRNNKKAMIAQIGAAIGGVGGATLWTAQGSYFKQSSELYVRELNSHQHHYHHRHINQPAGGRRSSKTTNDTTTREDEVVMMMKPEEATTYLAGIFAFLCLGGEVALKSLSTVLLGLLPHAAGGAAGGDEVDGNSAVVWSMVFGIYTVVAIASTMGMALCVDDYHHVVVVVASAADVDNDVFEEEEEEEERRATTSSRTTVATGGGKRKKKTSATSSKSSSSCWYEMMTSVLRLCYTSSKMKYLIGLTSIFGLSGAFVNSYVNGEVIPLVLHDTKSQYVGVYNAYLSIVATVCSLLLAKIQSKGLVLVCGALSFGCVALPFLLMPDVTRWNWFMLLFLYTCHGVGRATFESTLKATFADYFVEKEAAFANIILQSGLSSVLGFWLSFQLTCRAAGPPPPSFVDGDALMTASSSSEGATTTMSSSSSWFRNGDSNGQQQHCVEYRDGTYHDVRTFEILICITALLAIYGYRRASSIHEKEKKHQDEDNHRHRLLSSTTTTKSTTQEQQEQEQEEDRAYEVLI